MEVYLPGQLPQEAVTVAIGIAANHDVPDHPSDEGASIEKKGDGDEPRLVIVAAERPLNESCQCEGRTSQIEFQYDIT